MSQLDANWGALPGASSSSKWWCTCLSRQADCSIWPPRLPRTLAISAGPRVKQPLGLIQSLDSVWLYSGRATLILRGPQGCHKWLCVSETFENNRAFWPVAPPPRPERLLWVSEWGIGEQWWTTFNLTGVREIRCSWDWRGNVWVCGRDRNTYKSGKQVRMGLQVH